MVLSQLSEHLSTNNLFNPFQSAYRSGHSTETALLKIVNDLLLSLDDGNVTLLTLLDLSAAFDTIDHAILLQRLQHDFGIQDIALDWFSSYLTGRTQSVTIQNHTSDPDPIAFGVPQGSVLGPVLFVLYTTPLSTIIAKHSVLYHSYADDSQLQKSAPPPQVPELVQSMQSCITDIKSWMTTNKLKFSDDKTEVMLVHSNRLSTSLSPPDSITVGNASVSLSTTVKNLGVTLHCHLTMKAHILNLIRSANLELRRISSIRHLLTTEATATLISAFVLSRLDYCNSLLYGCPQHLLHRLQKVQNSAARLVLQIPKTDHISPYLASLHWLPIRSRITYKISSICYNCLHLTAPDYLKDLLTTYTPTRQLRSSSDTSILQIPLVRTQTFGERSFSHSAPSVWNSLPHKIRSTGTISSFKSNLKTHLFRQAY